MENYDDSEPLILSPDEEVSIAVIAQEIAYRMGFNGTIFYNQKLDGQLRKPSDNSKMKKLIGDFRFTPIEKGLEESIDWFVENYEKAKKMSKIIDGKVGGELWRRERGCKRRL